MSKNRKGIRMLNHKIWKKYWWAFIILSFIFLLAVILLTKYFLVEYAEQVQGVIKNSVTAKVKAREAELNEVVVEMTDPDFPKAIARWNRGENVVFYKELNNAKVSKIFDDFSTSVIANNMDKPEGGYVNFFTSSFAAYLAWGDYEYGFYYSKEDKPIEVFMGTEIDSDTKVYQELDSFIKYWYRTEKITDNWWYYEAQWTYGNTTPR